MVTASDDLLCRIAPNWCQFLLFLLYEWPSFSTDMYSTDIMENEFGPIPMTFTKMLLNKSCIKLNKCYVFLYTIKLLYQCTCCFLLYVYLSVPQSNLWKEGIWYIIFLPSIGCILHVLESFKYGNQYLITLYKSKVNKNVGI